ncbi:hypothetical protein SAMN04490239_0090 [Rhodococcus koreensis]|uniref:Uncharacterized protein n=1 Tax=Rhodococcus koreensis TaxID=99653 RepID=A0A1H4I654_9NOCA|nr:hypothetical protein SAMN04490239_0090 [Rhodococcus koreensis]
MRVEKVLGAAGRRSRQRFCQDRRRSGSEASKSTRTTSFNRAERSGASSWGTPKVARPPGRRIPGGRRPRSVASPVHDVAALSGRVSRTGAESHGEWRPGADPSPLSDPTGTVPHMTDATRRRRIKKGATRQRRVAICASCGWRPGQLTASKRVPAHDAYRGGRCRGADEKPAWAVVPNWVEPGGYAPAFATKQSGLEFTAPERPRPGTLEPQIVAEPRSLPDSSADTDRVRQPGVFSGGAPSLGRRR